MQYLKHEIGTKTQRDTMFVWKSLYVMKSKQPITDIKMLHLFFPKSCYRESNWSNIVPGS